MSKSLRLVAVSLLAACAAVVPVPSAHAQPDEGKLNLLQQKLDDQQKALDAQAEQIRAQRAELKKLFGSQSKRKNATTAQKNARRPASKSAHSAKTAHAQVALPAEKTAAPLKEPARTEQDRPPRVDVLADQGGILSPPGMLTYENSFEYTNTTRNLFSFNGVQLAQVVLVGELNDNSARHQLVQYAGRVRLGLTDRLEADVHIPYAYRNDALTGVNTANGAISRTSLEGHGMGDIDAGLAYQLNRGRKGWPFLIGNVRYKANNADGAFDVPYDSNNTATRLPTGTGFQTIEGSVTAIKVSDPAVLFANLGYVYDMPRDINKSFGTTYVGHVKPGDAINALVGMGFAVNQETSFSLGYKHSYVFPTIQNSVDLTSGTPMKTRGESAQVGSLVTGLNYTFTPSTSINLNVEAGVTSDAPDVHLMVRLPIQFGTIF